MFVPIALQPSIKQDQPMQVCKNVERVGEEEPKQGLCHASFQILITAAELRRCNALPWAHSQVKFFVSGCVGCVITAQVIIDQGIMLLFLHVSQRKTLEPLEKTWKKREKRLKQ